MRRFKTPQEKKRESYTLDRRSTDEYPHSSRRNRPRKKARGQRKYRRQSEQLLRTAKNRLDPDDARPELPNFLREGTWRKSGDISLAEKVNRGLDRRVWRIGWNCFKRGYSPAGRGRFKQIAIALIQGNSENSAKIAQHFNAIINGDGDGFLRYWLNRFFDDEPSIAAEFKQWIRQMLNKNPGQ